VVVAVEPVVVGGNGGSGVAGAHAPEGTVVSRARKRPKDAATFAATIPLRTSPAQAREVGIRFECARLLYNACLQVALDRAEAMRADPTWEQAMVMPRVVASRRNPARARAFRDLRARHGFGERALMSVAS
jgi:hypothetical protein